MFFTQIGIMVLTVATAFYGGSASNASLPEQNAVSEVYEYPVTPKDPEWAELGSTRARIEACRIPQEVLKEMTEEQLVQAILDFPFVYELFVYSYIETGVQSMEKNCDAYAELLRRGTAKDVLMSRAVQCRARVATTVEQELENDILAALILYQEQIEGKMSAEEISQVRELSGMAGGERYEEYKAGAEAAGVPKTPNGTAVAYTTPSCPHSEAYHLQCDQGMADTYLVTLVSVGNCKYNCHSYAWHDQSTSNIYWIANPVAYMTDGSYDKILSGLNASSLTAAIGDIIFYGEVSDTEHAHSAIMDSAPSGAPLASRTVVSKWGQFGVFRHTLTNVPPDYDISNISVWH